MVQIEVCVLFYICIRRSLQTLCQDAPPYFGVRDKLILCVQKVSRPTDVLNVETECKSNPFLKGNRPSEGQTTGVPHTNGHTFVEHACDAPPHVAPVVASAIPLVLSHQLLYYSWL